MKKKEQKAGGTYGKLMKADNLVSVKVNVIDSIYKDWVTD